MRLGMLRECANWFMCISPHPNVFLRGPVLHAGFIWMAPPASSSAVSSPGVLPMSSRSTEQPTLPGSMGGPGGLGLSLSRCLAWFQDMFNRNRAKGGARIPAQLGAGL